jgi:hypothetical protein
MGWGTGYIEHTGVLTSTEKRRAGRRGHPTGSTLHFCPSHGVKVCVVNRSRLGYAGSRPDMLLSRKERSRIETRGRPWRGGWCS